MWIAPASARMAGSNETPRLALIQPNGALAARDLGQKHPLPRHASPCQSHRVAYACVRPKAVAALV